MSRGMIKCKTKNCPNHVKQCSLSGVCRTCQAAERRAKLRRCGQCDTEMGNRVKGNLCGCCISINRQRKQKTCKTCGIEVSHENTTGMCWSHLVQHRAEVANARHSKPPMVRPFTVGQLISSAAFVTCTTEDEIRTDRFRFFVRIRFAIAHLAKPYYSTIQIGRALGGKDHSTIVHGQGRALDLMTDNGFVTLMQSIETHALALRERERNAIAYELKRIAA